MKPFTQVYGFFDNVDVNRFCFPKLVEITMVDGVFEVGEIGGLMPGYTTVPTMSWFDQVLYSPAVMDPVHKFGPYNDPSDVFDRNPYDRNNVLPTAYTESTTILNVDTFSLAEESP